MRRILSRLLGAILALGFHVPATESAPPRYRCIISPGTLDANGVNNQGEVVGTLVQGDSYQCFHYEAGVVTPFGPAGDASYAHAISDSGWIAGVANVSGFGYAMMFDDVRRDHRSSARQTWEVQAGTLLHELGVDLNWVDTDLPPTPNEIFYDHDDWAGMFLPTRSRSAPGSSSSWRVPARFA